MPPLDPPELPLLDPPELPLDPLELPLDPPLDPLEEPPELVLPPPEDPPELLDPLEEPLDEPPELPLEPPMPPELVVPLELAPPEDVPEPLDAPGPLDDPVPDPLEVPESAVPASMRHGTSSPSALTYVLHAKAASACDVLPVTSSPAVRSPSALEQAIAIVAAGIIVSSQSRPLIIRPPVPRKAIQQASCPNRPDEYPRR